MQVVDDFSSKLDLAQSIETVQSIDANHMQMARCTSRNDPRYRSISTVLRRAVQKTLQEQADETRKLKNRISPNYISASGEAFNIVPVADMGARMGHLPYQNQNQVPSQFSGVSNANETSLRSIKKSFSGSSSDTCT
jgi:hypothetical protein